MLLWGWRGRTPSQPRSGQGWPVAAGPHNSTGVKAPGEPRRARPYGRAQTFWVLLGRLPKVPRRKGETRRKNLHIQWICTQCSSYINRVHIHFMYHRFLRVTPLRRVTLQKRQSNQNASAPAYGPRFAQVSLAPVPLRGHAVTGHPWPNTALPASMPVDPLRETSSRPPEGAADQKPSQKPDQRPDQRPDQKLDHEPSYLGFTLTGARPCAHWHSNPYYHPIPHPKQQSTAR